MKKGNYKAGKKKKKPKLIEFNYHLCKFCILPIIPVISYLYLCIIKNYFFSIAHLELKLQQCENELFKSKEQVTTITNNNNKNELTIKRLKKQFFIVTWVYNGYYIITGFSNPLLVGHKSNYFYFAQECFT